MNPFNILDTATLTLQT
ncbi:hypothetical protein V3C99_007202 [Haemonchus contortus]